MRIDNSRLPRRFSAARRVLCVILVITAAGMLTTPVEAAGMFTHDEVVQYALSLIASDPDIANLLNNYRAVVNYGSVWPDWGYAVQQLGGGGPIYGDLSEDAHGDTFIKTLAARLVPLFDKQNRTVDEDKALAFLFGVIAHKATDDPWHFGEDGINGTADDPFAFEAYASGQDGQSRTFVELCSDIGFRAAVFDNSNYFEYWYPEQALLDTYSALGRNVSAGDLSDGAAHQLDQYNLETAASVAPVCLPLIQWTLNNIWTYYPGGIGDGMNRTADAWQEYWGWLDSYAPGITISLSPEVPDGSNGSYRQPVTITLSATDYLDRPIDVHYGYDGTDNIYTDPITLSTDGTYQISIWAIDDMGNRTDQVVTVIIDQTPLTAVAACNGDNLVLTITSGNGPFNVSGTGNRDLPRNGVPIGRTEFTGPGWWMGLTVTETTAGLETLLLGDFACFPPREPALIDVVVEPHTAHVGDVVLWTITVSNPGPGLTDPVTVTGTFPADLRPLPETLTTTRGAAAFAGQQLTVSSIGALNPGEDVVITVQTEVVKASASLSAANQTAPICFTGYAGYGSDTDCVNLPTMLPPTGGGSPLAATLRGLAPWAAGLVAALSGFIWMTRRRR